MRRGNLFVISGPSGAGKGTLVARLVQAVPDAWVSVSATTRAPRKGEIDGVHYQFKTPEQFQQLIDTDGLLEWAEYSSNRYGTPRASVAEHMAAGQQVILEIDVQGAFQIREKVPEAHLIFIEPPSMEVLEARLRGRGTETEEVIEQRLSAAKVELSRKMEYDIQLVNDDLTRRAPPCFLRQRTSRENARLGNRMSIIEPRITDLSTRRTTTAPAVRAFGVEALHDINDMMRASATAPSSCKRPWNAKAADKKPCPWRLPKSLVATCPTTETIDAQNH